MSKSAPAVGERVKLRHGEVDGPDARSTLRLKGLKGTVIKGPHMARDEDGRPTRECVVVESELNGGVKGQPLQVPVEYLERRGNGVGERVRSVFAGGTRAYREGWDRIFGRREKESSHA